MLTLALSSSVSSSLTCFKTHALTCFTTCALTCFKTCVLTCFKTCACVFTCFHVFPCTCWFLVRPNLNLIGGDMGPWLAHVVVLFNIYHSSSASFHTRAHAACMHAHPRACVYFFYVFLYSAAFTLLLMITLSLSTTSYNLDTRHKSDVWPENSWSRHKKKMHILLRWHFWNTH